MTIEKMWLTELDNLKIEYKEFIELIDESTKVSTKKSKKK